MLFRSGFWVSCQYCGDENELGHDEVCARREPWMVARHELVKKAIAGTLSSMEGVRVELEPSIGTTRRRNDIRVIGSRQSGIGSQEYDITVISLATQQARSTYLPPSVREGTSPTNQTTALINKHLQAIANEKRNNLPEPSDVPFTPLVFTLGGLMDKDTVKAASSWKDSLSSGAFRNLLTRLSLILLKARVRNFDL